MSRNDRARRQKRREKKRGQLAAASQELGDLRAQLQLSGSSGLAGPVARW